MILKYNRIIPEEDLIGRVMGPDHTSPKSFVWDSFGQQWVNF